MTANIKQRPLDGIRVVELGSMAPAPFCAMVLADFGADVALVERPGGVRGGIDPGWPALFARGKRAVAADLKTDAGRELVKHLASRADILIEGFRPGVTERLGLGPEPLMAANPRLIYTRVTGWGQQGPYADRPGHDINYLALSGTLSQIGIDSPLPPNAFLGDFASGSLTATIGILMALQARTRTGRGQVVDAAIVDGASMLMEAALEMERRGHRHARGEGIVDGNAPFYRAYRCADGKWFSVGAIEPKFYTAFLTCLGIEDEPLERQMDRSHWPVLSARVARIFLSKSQAEWERVFLGSETCAAPVLESEDLVNHPHLAARARFSKTPGGVPSAKPAPLLSETPGHAGAVSETVATNIDSFLTQLGWE